VTAIALGHRADDLVERMDDPQCDLALLERTYRDFRHVNALISGWHGIYRRRIRPVLQRSVDPTLLDIGFGGGDIPRRIEQWAERDGIPVRITAVDPDPRAFAFAITGPATAVHFRELATDDLVRAGERFDVVVSNHVLHHLDGTLGPLLADSRRLARHLVVHGDIERSRWAYGAYSALTLPLARRSFVREDGLLSIRRSYRARAQAAAGDDGWRVERRFPARLLLVHESPPHHEPDEGMPR
jgi:2-polyprenyl-3-methyl-5-hydroxy-6-metoxy-1,4-benzoquinol methylase